ncbi:MAG: FeoB-associated Cys-rich membrane protein [Eubacteriales bacterium]|nr:FeoB-associated Cys-rich membrane protein [Clostridiales bacterium]MDD7306819.1 FeoB-associated Cys-rich membrane protein [Eubacteriales bacterium]MDY2933217.1 FeoB-associated Cys-rich membrane protein [Anaerovoracaceae bacterium]
MFTWITENIATIIIALVLALIVAAIVIYLVNNKKQGKSSCGCKCGGCPMSGSCHKH